LTTAAIKQIAIRVTSEEVTIVTDKKENPRVRKGDNSSKFGEDDDDPMFDTSPAKMEAAGAKALLQFIERVERMEEEKKSIADDIKDVYAEAKANGYDTKIMREMVRLRKMEPHARQERDALIETYRAAIGIA
jgi:uncharacterized protein (UPF0335 family)